MGTMILLDTNALLWLLGDSARLGPIASQLIASARAVYSSPVSLFEISVKSMLGKLSVPPQFASLARDQGLQELPFTHSHAQAIEAFPELARHDPFDRLILAQAYVEGFTLLTADRVLLSLGRPFVRDVRS